MLPYFLKSYRRTHLVVLIILLGLGSFVLSPLARSEPSPDVAKPPEVDAGPPADSEGGQAPPDALSSDKVPPPMLECGTELTKEGAVIREKQEQLGAYKPPGQIMRYVLEVPLTIHIVRRANATGGLNPADVPGLFAFANAFWFPTGIQFFQVGNIDFIDNDGFFFDIDTIAEIDQLRQTNVVADTVNVYFTPNLVYESRTICGISSFTSDTTQGIVIACFQPTHTTFAHELGHYFDVLHTHETGWLCVECPSGSNCTICGDRLCDTPADPTLSALVVDASCNYIGTATACGGQSYNPDTHNLMSYSTQTCRDHFSNGQQDLALATLVNLRPRLIGAPGLQVTWVDFNAAINGCGSYAWPFNSLNSALQATAAGGTIVFQPGSSSTAITINQSVTLDAFRGIVTIGQ